MGMKEPDARAERLTAEQWQALRNARTAMEYVAYGLVSTRDERNVVIECSTENDARVVAEYVKALNLPTMRALLDAAERAARLERAITDFAARVEIMGRRDGKHVAADLRAIVAAAGTARTPQGEPGE